MDLKVIKMDFKWILKWLQIIFQRMCYTSNLSNTKEKKIMCHDTSICSKLNVTEFATLCLIFLPNSGVIF